MKSIKKISVIIPTLNDTDYLYQAINSVLDQTVKKINIEVLIIDSSSDNAVQSVAEEYGSAVRYIWTEPEGVAAARNCGVDLAEGNVIGFCDADDYWHPEKIEKQLPYIENGCDIVYSDEYIIDEGNLLMIKSLPINDPDRHHVDYFRQGGVGSRTVLVRKRCLQEEQFNEEFVVREDPHLWTRLFKYYEPCRVGEPLSFKRRRDSSLTSDRDMAYEMQLKEIEELVNRFPELELYKKEREIKSRLHYAKTLISDEDRGSDARRVLFSLLYEGHICRRLGILLIFSLIPIGADKALKMAQRFQYR